MVAGALAAVAAGANRRRVGCSATEPEVVEAGDVEMEGFSSMTPFGEGEQLPVRVYEGAEEVDMSEKQERPSGSNEDSTYFWKMTQDKRQLEVIVPVDDSVEAKDVVYRLGEDPEDSMRGPLLQLGHRYKDEDGRARENLLINGQLLNAVRREECFWILDEMVGVKVIILTVTRPSMKRFRHDPILKRKTEEERIEPQTWDALLVEDRIKPNVTNKVFMDIELDGKPAGRIEYGLFGELLPVTTENFLGLIKGTYVDEAGKEQKSAHCYKDSAFSYIGAGHIISGGNPGLDLTTVEFTHDELQEYYDYFKEFATLPKKIGKVEKNWVPRWGADLGLGEDRYGVIRKEGQACDSSNGVDGELTEVCGKMEKLLEKGEGAKIIFFRPEWEKGCDMRGGTFQGESFKVPAMKRGMLAMDRDEGKDVQGSVFFITLKEFPAMDKRWCCFGEILSGMEIIDEMEEDFEARPQKIRITDCGELPLDS